MAHNQRDMDVPLEAVWAVLADADVYSEWVVGARDIKFADPSWPERGATFHHEQGLPVLNLEDTTTVIECQPREHLLLEVRVRPILIGLVEFRLDSLGPFRTRVDMWERPKGRTSAGVAGALWNPLFDRSTHKRNIETLRRLEDQARRRTGAAG